MEEADQTNKFNFSIFGNIWLKNLTELEVCSMTDFGWMKQHLPKNHVVKFSGAILRFFLDSICSTSGNFNDKIKFN